MKKILILPSWYPSKQNPQGGVFFRDYVSSISLVADTRVLVLDGYYNFSVVDLISPRKVFRFIRRNLRCLMPTKSDSDFYDLNVEYVYEIPSTCSLRWRWRYFDCIIQKMASEDWWPDLVYAHGWRGGGIYAKFLKDKYSIPYILTEHLPLKLCLSDEGLARPVFSEASKFLTICESQVRTLSNHEIIVRPVSAYNPINSELFSVVARRYLPRSKLKLVTIGSGSRLKDYETLLKAVAIAKRKGVEFTLTCIGLSAYGGNQGEVYDAVRRLDLFRDVVVIALATREQIKAIFSDSHLYIQASISETFCVSICEAMMCGLPVFSTDHGGGSLNFISKETGRCLGYRDFSGMADSIQEFFEGRIVFDNLMIKRRSEKNFSLQSYSELFEHILLNLSEESE